MNPVLRVLIVEDDENDALLVVRELKRSYEVSWDRVETAAAMEAALDEGTWEIIVSDYSLPTFSGPDALKLLQKKGVDLPFIIISGTIGEEVAVEVMKAGADDYVMKDNPVRLAPAVRRALKAAEERRERKRAEMKLRESEERLTRAQQVAHFGCWDWNIVTGSLYWTEGIYRVFGLEPREFGATFDAFLNSVHPDDRQFVQERVDAAVKHNAGYMIDHRIVLPDGRERWVQEQGEVTRDDSGNPVRMLGTVMDITERKRSEEALRQSEDKYRTLVKNLPQKIFLKDTDSTYVSCNENYANDLKISPDEIAGKIDFDFYPKELAEKYRADDRKVMEAGVTEELEERYVQDDREFFVNTVKTPVRDPDGNVAGVLGIFWDITERRQLEQQFRLAQKMEAVGRLAGGIAHDFNNMLAAIMGYADLGARNLKEGDPLREDLEQISQVADRAANLVRQLLAFSRKQMLETSVLDLNSVVSEMDRMLGRVIGEDIDISTSLHPELKRVKADPSQIEQVVVNLAVNARDAMPEGGKLTIETANVVLDDAYAGSHVDVEPGRYVVLAVSDTGCGMDEETSARIFEPFYTTKEPGKGTGLGLATVYGIVRQSGGHIWVYSEPGRGTTFKIYLPQVEEPADQRETKKIRPQKVTGSETVLVVEDEEVLRRLVSRILESNGYKVLQAGSGGEALLLCEQHKGPIQLMLTDVVMPGMSGMKLAERLSGLCPAMRVLYMSGYTEGAIQHNGELDEDAAFVQKPFTPRDLASKVREVLDGPE